MNDEFKLYSRSKNNIWTDKWISKNMLAAHLDISNDAASRNINTINKTIDWISQSIASNSRLLDLGCGPGLYAEIFCRKGNAVTGIDISRRSINYAKRSASKQHLAIKYIHQDYIEENIEGIFDSAVCIYCDFGALIPSEQINLLKNIHAVLTKDGILIFDVFTKGLSRNKKEQKQWTYYKDGGFWNRKPHFVLEETVHYPQNNAWGSRSIVIADDTKEYITWDTYYSRDQIAALLKDNGFKLEEINEDLIEKNDFTSNEVMFIKARRI